MSIDAMKQALEALERGETKLRYAAIIALRAAIENEEIHTSEQIHTSVSSNTHQCKQERADAHLFYAPGDVLICKESGEKVKVVNGNTGPLQLANGNITLEWDGDDGVFGEYTLQQIMDEFIREVRAEPERQTVFNCPRCGHGCPETAPEPVAWAVELPDGTRKPLYTHPARQPLTDEEIEKLRHLIDWTAEWSYNTFARAIEAAHGIKESR